MERAVKERLAGAVIIVALVVIFVPMLFDGEGYRELSRVQVEMPEPPALVFGQHFPAFDDKAAPDAAPAIAPVVVPSPSATARTAPPRRPPVVAAPSVPSAPTTPNVSRRGMWIVQTGAFAIRKNADAQRAKLRKAGFDPVFYKWDENRRDRTVYYVRIGPYERRPAAAGIVERLRREHGLEAIIKAYDDDD